MHAIKQTFYSLDSIDDHTPTSSNTRDAISDDPPEVKKPPRPKRRRCLFSDDSYLGQCEKRISAVLPEVLFCLDEHKYLEDFVHFFELVAEDAYPLDCIALPCFLDTVRWYSQESTSNMAYRDETKLFWRVVYKLFHGTGVRFFSGTKSLGQILTGEGTRGSICPQNSEINFAVPNTPNLVAEITSIPKVTPPGVIHGALQMKSSSDESMVLSIDGKKLAMGLTQDWGDQDLMGFEVPNLKESKNQLEKELGEFADLNACIENETDKSEVIERITNCITTITLRIKQLRELKVSQTFHLTKLQKKSR